MVNIRKNLANLLRRTAIVSSVAIPFVFGGCEKDDITPPKIYRYSPEEGKNYNSDTVPLEWNIIEDNFKSAWYSTNDGQTKTPLEQSGKKDLNLSNGNQKLIVFADDKQNNFSTDTVSFYVNKVADTTPPKIKKISPLEGKVYNSYIIPFQWVIEDENFKSAWYSLDNAQTKLPIEQFGFKNLDLINGTYKLIIFADDRYNHASRDSINFSVNAGMLIDPFTSPDANGATYNTLTTRAERDAYIQAKLNEDWVNTIPPSLNIPLWVCGHYAMQLNTNSRDWGEGVLIDNTSFGEDLLYNGYKGRNVDSIKINGGTLVDMGYLGLPMGIVILSDKTHSPPDEPFGHAMNWVLTGYDLTKLEHYTIIDPQNDMINVQPPHNCDEVRIDYEYVTENKFLEYITLVKFRIENGIPSLIWKNDDPNLNLITQRGK